MTDEEFAKFERREKVEHYMLLEGFLTFLFVLFLSDWFDLPLLFLSYLP